MDDNTRKVLTFIAGLHDGAEYGKVSKSDLWEALKRARHHAKAALAEAAAHA